MTNDNNIDLDYLFEKKEQESEIKGIRGGNRQFYGQDGQLPNRWDLLTWSVVFIGMFIFFALS